MMKKIMRALAREVGIEFKACLYFFAILFFYCIYRITQGSYEAQMLVMLEMILTTYVMGYVQVYLLRNFEESEKPGGFELLAVVGCSLVYAAISYFFGWFDGKLLPEVLFFVYVVICYVSLYGVYYVRRHWDTEELNKELEDFKKTKKSQVGREE